jgi:hypothetical protein
MAQVGEKRSMDSRSEAEQKADDTESESDEERVLEQADEQQATGEHKDALATPIPGVQQATGEHKDALATPITGVQQKHYPVGMNTLPSGMMMVILPSGITVPLEVVVATSTSKKSKTPVEKTVLLTKEAILNDTEGFKTTVQTLNPGDFFTIGNHIITWFTTTTGKNFRLTVKKIKTALMVIKKANTSTKEDKEAVAHLLVIIKVVGKFGDWTFEEKKVLGDPAKSLKTNWEDKMKKKKEEGQPVSKTVEQTTDP